MLKQCSTLTHHSLESFIIEQTEDENAYRLLQIAQHPQISTIGEKVSQVFNIFCQETYKSAKGKNLTGLLNQKQLKSLRKVSILVFFQGKNSVRINELCQQLDVDKLSLFRIIMEMTTKDLINARIDERNNQINIYASKVRRLKGLNKEALTAECQARLLKIFQKNSQLISQISKSQ